MSRDYGTPLNEYDYQPYVAAANKNEAPVDSQGERHRKVFEFDVSDPKAYESLIADSTKMPTLAWQAYFQVNTTPPSYSPENALKLQEAIEFYLYINEWEEVNFDQTQPTDGVVSDGEQIRLDSVPLNRYEPFENPNVFSNHDEYVEAIGGDLNNPQPIPLIKGDGEEAPIDVTDKPWLVEMFSHDYLNNMTQYETTHSNPKTEYEWGGAYATGRNTY